MRLVSSVFPLVSQALHQPGRSVRPFLFIYLSIDRETWSDHGKRAILIYNNSHLVGAAQFAFLHRMMISYE